MKSQEPLCFYIADLPAGGVSVTGRVPLHAIDIPDDDLLVCNGDMVYALTLAPIDDGVLVRGSLATRVSRVCDRCLTLAPLDVSVTDVCHHFEHVEGRYVDLTEHLREDILLAFPQGYVCGVDCRGLCPGCGQNLNEAACECARSDDDDDPWAALASLGLDD